MTSSQRPSTRTFKSARQLEVDEPVKKSRTPKKLPKIKLPSKNWSTIIIIVLVIASAFMFMQYRSAQNKLAGPAKDNEKYTKRLSKMILLPKNETPTIATVKDVTKLKDQTFFVDAQNGDKLFVFNKAKKAFLYRPSTNMIINVQPVSN